MAREKLIKQYSGEIVSLDIDWCKSSDCWFVFFEIRDDIGINHKYAAFREGRNVCRLLGNMMRALDVSFSREVVGKHVDVVEHDLVFNNDGEEDFIPHKQMLSFIDSNGHAAFTMTRITGHN